LTNATDVEPIHLILTIREVKTDLESNTNTLAILVKHRATTVTCMIGTSAQKDHLKKQNISQQAKSLYKDT
jgi:hypothetical protein